MIVHLAIVGLQHVEPGLGGHTLEIGILERAGRRVGLDGVRCRAVPGNDTGHKGSMTVTILARTWPFEPVAKRSVAVIHSGVVDVEINVSSRQSQVILLNHVGHVPIRIGLGLEHLHTKAWSRQVIGQTSRSMPLKPLHLAKPGQGSQFVAWHPGHELGPERRPILRQHLDAEPGQALGRGRFAIGKKHHIEQRPIRHRLTGNGQLEQLHLQLVVRLERQDRLRAVPVGQTLCPGGVHPHEIGVVGDVRNDAATARGDVPPKRRRGRAARLGNVR